MTNKHTPAPWKMQRHADFIHIQHDIDRQQPYQHIAKVAIYSYGQHDAEANAHLIVAAPELLAALEIINKAIHANIKGDSNEYIDLPDIYHEIEEINRVLNKAKAYNMSNENKEDILYWHDESGLIELELTQWHLDNQPIQGECESSVLEALDYKHEGIPTLSEQLENTGLDLRMTAIKYGSKDYGNEGVPTMEEAFQFIVWIAIGDLQEQQAQEG